jgi:hypothetical protein
VRGRNACRSVVAWRISEHQGCPAAPFVGNPAGSSALFVIARLGELFVILASDEWSQRLRYRCPAPWVHVRTLRTSQGPRHVCILELSGCLRRSRDQRPRVRTAPCVGRHVRRVRTCRKRQHVARAQQSTLGRGALGQARLRRDGDFARKMGLVPVQGPLSAHDSALPCGLHVTATATDSTPAMADADAEAPMGA